MVKIEMVWESFFLREHSQFGSPHIHKVYVHPIVKQFVCQTYWSITVMGGGRSVIQSGG